MAIADTADFAAAVAQSHDIKLLADPAGDALPKVEAAGDVLALIGPEGGFTDAEQAAAREAGCVAWRLAPHVLRIETAAVAAAAILRSR